MSWRLYLDIGNHALKYAVRREGEWIADGVIPFIPDEELETVVQEGPAIVTQLNTALTYASLDLQDCAGGGYCSCNPHVDSLLAALGEALPCALRPLENELREAVQTEYHEPRQLGPDRLANAYAAYRLYGGPCVVIDLGTCITSEVVRADGTLAGGAIAAGRAALMAGILITVPHLEEPLLLTDIPEMTEMMGRSSAECLMVGIALQLAATTERLVAEAAGVLQVADLTAVMTGGDADLVEPLLDLPVLRNERLTLEGLRLLDRCD